MPSAVQVGAVSRLLNFWISFFLLRVTLSIVHLHIDFVEAQVDVDGVGTVEVAFVVKFNGGLAGV
jgi:hypothetical protein